MQKMQQLVLSSLTVSNTADWILYGSILCYCRLTGSPKYFEPILHYLRSNSVEVPPGLSRVSLRNEAEFYGIQKLVDHFDQLAEIEKAKSEPPKKGKYVSYSEKQLKFSQCPANES